MNSFKSYIAFELTNQLVQLSTFEGYFEAKKKG
jgi:hypothetical protein